MRYKHLHRKVQITLACYGFHSCHPRAAVSLFVPGHPVQEDERNSTEERATPQSALDPRSQTGTLLTSSSPIGPDVVTGTDEGRGRLHQGQEKWASSSRSPSSSTSQFQRLLRPTSHPRRRTVAGNTDREALLFPEETTNNRADTSGAAHLTDGPVSASQRTRPYFQNTFSSVATFHTLQSTNTKSYKFPQTQMPLKPSAASSTSNTASTDVARITVSRTAELFTVSRDYPPVSDSFIPSFTSSLPDLPSWISWKAETTLNPLDASLAPGEKEPNSWRSQRSTDRLNSDLISAATSGPLKTVTAQQKGDSGSGPTTSTLSSSVRNPGETSAPTQLTLLPTAVEALSSHPDGSDSDSVASVTPNVTTHASASESSGKSERIQVSQTFTFPPRSQTSSLQSTALATRAVLSYVTSPFTQMSKDTPPTPTAPRDSESVSLLPDWIITASSSTPRAASTLEDVAQNAAATFTHLHHQLPTVSPTPVPHFSSVLSSAPSHKLQSHTGSPSTHKASTAAEPSGHSTTPVTPRPSPVTSTTSHSPHQPATRDKSHGFSTTTHVTSPRTPVSEHKHGEEKEEKSWQWLPSSTPGGPSQKPGTTLHVHPENHTAASSGVPASTTSHTPKFFIVPDQPTAIKGAQSITCN